MSRCFSLHGKDFNEHHRDSAVLTGNLKEEKTNCLFILCLFSLTYCQRQSVSKKNIFWLIQTHFFAIVINNSYNNTPCFWDKIYFVLELPFTVFKMYCDCRTFVYFVSEGPHHIGCYWINLFTKRFIFWWTILNV